MHHDKDTNVKTTVWCVQQWIIGTRCEKAMISTSLREKKKPSTPPYKYLGHIINNQMSTNSMNSNMLFRSDSSVAIIEAFMHTMYTKIMNSFHLFSWFLAAVSILTTMTQWYLWKQLNPNNFCAVHWDNRRNLTSFFYYEQWTAWLCMKESILADYMEPSRALICPS